MNHTEAVPAQLTASLPTLNNDVTVSSKDSSLLHLTVQEVCPDFYMMISLTKGAIKNLLHISGLTGEPDYAAVTPNANTCITENEK